MPAMFIERKDNIAEDEWRAAVAACGFRFADGSLDVEMPDRDGTFRHVLTWRGACAEFSMMSYYQPFIDHIEALARAVRGFVVDNDGAIYFES